MPRRELSVAGADAGRRLDAFLAAPLGSRARAARLIEQGRVLVDGRARPKRHVLAGGERISVEDDEPAAPPGGPPAQAPPLAYADEHLVVVDKPAGMVVHPARGHATGTLAQALAGIAGGGEDPARAGIVHRLDRDTSGLIVVARGEEVLRGLRAAMSARRIEREYLALVEGHVESRTGTIDAPLGRDRSDRTRASIDTDAPRPAVTDFELVRALPGASLVAVRLRTGRTHQIRAHMRAIGHQVAGDPVYGQPGLYGLRRQFLHAARLAFDHPVGGARVDVRSPLPEDLRNALERAQRGER